jgi:hypothetical protein
MLVKMAGQSCVSETAWHKHLIRAEVLIELKALTKSVLLPWSIVCYPANLS